jgi:predicted HTH transcriptional regulator
MFETPEQLLSQLRLGEDSTLECKSIAFAGDKVRAPGREELADELVAFANAGGGVLVLGVADKTRRLEGIPVERLDAAERFAAEICHDTIRPPLLARIRRLLVVAEDGSERAILRIDVPRSLFVHEGPGGYFYRVGSSKRRMAPDYLARLLAQRSQARIIHFDEQIVPETTLDDLDSELTERFRTPRTKDTREVLLRKLAMAREDEDGTLRPTVAGILCATRQPERWLRHAFIQAVAYRGEEILPAGSGAGYQLDARDITGPLDLQVVEACRFVVRNMRVEASKRVGRVDVPQYDVTALLEALVNAVAHRDYSMYGAKIRLRLFANRLELFSPGALSNTMTVDSLPLRQSARNEALTSLLAKCPVPSDVPGLETTRTTLMDRRGEGVAILLDRSEKLSGRRPVYELIDDSELRLTIFAASALG